jgi:hypothetical protein
MLLLARGTTWVRWWVTCGTGERCSRAEQLEHRVQPHLGIFSVRGL